MMHTLDMLKDKRAIDNGNIPYLVTILAELLAGPGMIPNYTFTTPFRCPVNISSRSRYSLPEPS